MRILLALSFILCCLFVTSEVSAQWIPGQGDTLTSNEVMDQNGSEALAIDSSGVLHVVWRQEVADSSWRILYMSKESEGDWSSPTEISFLFPNNGVPAIEVEYSTGIAHVVWHGLDTLDGDTEIFYATNESGIWVTIAMTSDTTDDYDPTIAVDGSGHVHMAWIGFDTLSSELKAIYATNLSGDLTVQILEESEPDECSDQRLQGPPSIAVTADGIAHISYFGVPLPGVWFSIHHIENETPGGTDWSDEATETNAYAYDEYSSIAVAGNGDLHLAITGQLGGPGECCYRTLCFHRPVGAAEWDSAQLATSCLVIPSCHFLEQVVLALDATENVHLVTATGTYSGHYSNSLLYSTDNYSDGWHTQLMLTDPTSTFFHSPSIVFDRWNHGHAILHNSHFLGPGAGDPLEIMYTRSAEPLWPKNEFVRGDVDGNTDLGMYDALLTLKYLYIPGSPAPSCMDAADTDDSGTIDMFDAIYTMRCLYVPGQPPPPPPFPDCGIDPTWDGLGCGSYPLCE